MNNLGVFGFLAIAVGVAALFALVGAIPVLVVRNLITRRPAAKHLREWLLYVLGAAVLILTFMGPYLYAEHKGIDENTTVKWMNIITTAIFVFASSVHKFWPARKRWTFWAELGVLMGVHFALLGRLHWTIGGYFWLILIFGIPELAVVFFLLGLMFNPNGNIEQDPSSSES